MWDYPGPVRFSLSKSKRPQEGKSPGLSPGNYFIISRGKTFKTSLSGRFFQFFPKFVAKGKNLILTIISYGIFVKQN